MRRLHLPIQDPCHENWDAMNREDEGRRFCDVCTKQVHDLSALTERRARSVLAEESRKGRVCVRYASDRDGNIKFRRELTEAPPSLWRMSVAAAGMTLALLSGCADKTPDAIQADRCVYEVGPWSFTAARGQGSCPAVTETEPEFVEIGEIAIDPPPDPPVEPVHEVMGDIEAEPEVEVVKGEVAAPDPEPEPVVMGKMPLREEPCEPTGFNPGSGPGSGPTDDGPRRL